VQPMVVGPPQSGSAVLGVGGQQMVMHRHVIPQVPPELPGAGRSHLYHHPAGESERRVRWVLMQGWRGEGGHTCIIILQVRVREERVSESGHGVTEWLLLGHVSQLRNTHCGV
jgi:hypothetical protein